MSTWVAFTWENSRLLLLSASVSGRTITFERSAALDDPKKLTELLTPYRLAKADTIVVLNRSDVEVRPMVFPPVPNNDLPDLVRFQVGREFNNYDPNAPVDFFVTSKLEDVSRSTLFPAVKPSDAESILDGAPKHILASTLRLNTLQQIKTFCEGHNLVLRHIVLRPCATASLWRRTETPMPGRSTLLVELDKNEMSQIVLFQGEPVFMRSPKIQRPQDVSTPDFCVRLLAELKRTRVAVRNEIQGTDVHEVVLCGSGVMFESLAEQLSKGLDMPVRLFDPLKGLTVKSDAVDERYSALLGAIQQVAQKETMLIDFCNPKKRIESTGKRNLFSIIAAAVMILVVSLFGYAFYRQSVLEGEVNTLNGNIARLKQETKTVNSQNQQLIEIDRWQADNINWFEQFEWLCVKSLPANDMMVENLSFHSVNGIKFRALLRNQSLSNSMQENFYDSDHDFQQGQRSQTDSSQYTFSSDVTILFPNKVAPPARITRSTRSVARTAQ